jgi:hypothetical protein
LAVERGLLTKITVMIKKIYTINQLTILIINIFLINSVEGWNNYSEKGEMCVDLLLTIF